MVIIMAHACHNHASCCHWQWSGLTYLLGLQRAQSCPALHCNNTAMQLFTLSPQELTAAAGLFVLQNVLCSDNGRGWCSWQEIINWLEVLHRQKVFQDGIYVCVVNLKLCLLGPGPIGCFLLAWLTTVWCSCSSPASSSIGAGTTVCPRQAVRRYCSHRLL